MVGRRRRARARALTKMFQKGKKFIKILRFKRVSSFSERRAPARRLAAEPELRARARSPSPEPDAKPEHEARAAAGPTGLLCIRMICVI